MNRWIGFAAGTVGLLGVVSCGGGKSNSSPASTSLSCTASATLVSPSEASANSAVTLDNLSVTIANGSSNYTVSVSGLPTANVTSSSYTFAGSFSATTDGSSGVSVGVTDVSSGGSASCEITLPTSSTSGGSGTGTTSSLKVTASPGTSVPLGTPVTLTVVSTDSTVNPTFTFTIPTAVNGLNVVQNPMQSNQATVTYNSSAATSATIAVTEFSANSTTAITSTQVTLSFGQGTSGGSTYVGSINCELFVNYMLASQNQSAPQTVYTGSPVNFQVVSQTGEPLQVTQVSPGENWSTSPMYPYSFPYPQVFNLTYQSIGVIEFSLVAQSAARPGYVCNSNNPLIAWLSLVY